MASQEAPSHSQDHSLQTEPPSLVPSLKRRMACWIYEGVLLFGVVFITGYLFSTLSQTRNALDNRHPLQAFIFLVFGVYFIWFWRHGQTLAMKTWKIRITNLSGTSISQREAITRYVLCWIWFVPPLAFSSFMGLDGLSALGIMIAWVVTWALSSKLNPTRQFWHDRWAKTQLIMFEI